MNIKLRISKYDHEGRGVSRNNNKVVFVPGAIEGELVDANIIEDKKNFSIAKINKILEPSPLRCIPKCPYFDVCGGCTFLHIDLANEEIIKEGSVKDIIKKYAKLDINPIFISSKEFYYRNKIELKIDNYNWGYYNTSSHDFISINECLIAKESINKIISNKDLFKIEKGSITIRSNYNDEIIIKIETPNNYKIDIDSLSKENKIIGIIVNNKLIYGEDNFIERVGGYLFKVNINSFFQINLDILDRIFKIIGGKNLGNIVDLYCGVGTLGIATKKNKLYGIEIIPEAIKDAIFNAKINKQHNNLYMLADSSKIKEIDEHIDTIIVDPPRSGLNKTTLNNIIYIKPDNIIYMSCNPITLARDLNVIKDNYSIESFYILNMFPRTKHIESLVFLKRSKNDR